MPIIMAASISRSAFVEIWEPQCTVPVTEHARLTNSAHQLLSSTERIHGSRRIQLIHHSMSIEQGGSVKLT